MNTSIQSPNMKSWYAPVNQPSAHESKAWLVPTENGISGELGGFGVGKSSRWASVSGYTTKVRRLQLSKVMHHEKVV